MSLALPAIDAPAAASRGDLQNAEASLAERARAFAGTPAREKAATLRALLPRLLEIAPAWAACVAARRGLDPGSDAAAEAWIAGPAAVIAYARNLAESLEDIASAGRPALAARDIGKRPDGRLVARLVPRSWTLRAAERGRETFVLFSAGSEPEDVIAEQAAFYRDREPEGGVAHVVASPTDAGMGLADTLHALFVEGRVALLAPGLDGAGPLIERALAPIVEQGFMRVVHGVEAEIDLASAKPVTAILGNVGPVIVVPCLYAKDELAFVAKRLASALAHGAGLDPASPRVVVVSSSWPQRGLFLDLLAQSFAAIPPRRAYLADGEAIPWVILPALDPAADEPLFAAPSGPTIGVVALSSNDPAEHLAVATAFCNERLAGSLAAEIIVHPVHEEDPVIGDAVDRAAVDLRYGAVGINQWPARLRFEGAAPWGPHLVGTIAAPRSGIGFRNDARMLPRVDKSVIRGPLRSPRALLFFQPDPGVARIARRLPAFAADPKTLDLWSLAGR